jgi:hypothetical protein
VPGLVGGEPVQCLDPLALGGDRPATAQLVGGHDDMHEPLEEVTLRIGARAPRRFERFVSLEELSAARELQAVLV